MLYAFSPCRFTCVLLPTEACRQTSTPETVLNKVQANEEEERLIRELELTTEERNELTDRLLYVTGGSMNKRYALLQMSCVIHRCVISFSCYPLNVVGSRMLCPPKDLLLNLLSHREEIQNLTLTEEWVWKWTLWFLLLKIWTWDLSEDFRDKVTGAWVPSGQLESPWQVVALQGSRCCEFVESVCTC